MNYSKSFALTVHMMLLVEAARLALKLVTGKETVWGGLRLKVDLLVG